MKKIIIYKPTYTVDTHRLCRVWALRAPRMSYDMIPRDWGATYMRYQGWALWAIKEYHLHIHACLPCVSYQVYFIAYLHTFPGVSYMGYRWAINSSWSVWRVRNYDTDRGQKVGLPSIQHWLGEGVRLSIRPSISFPVARSFYFPIIRCLWPGFCLDNLMFSCSLGITHHSLILCNLSVP